MIAVHSVFKPGSSMFKNHFCQNLFYSNFSWKKLKRFLRNPKIRKLLVTCFLLMLILLYIFGVKLPHEKSIKAEQVTLQIMSVMGTRLTAVRLLPDKNTTRLQPNFHCNDDLFSIILIKSTPDKYWKRQLIRNTWFKLFSKLNENVKAFFFVGIPAGKEISLNLMSESDNFGDIIIEELDEHHYLQTLKSLRMLKWFNSSNSCLNSRFLIKTDDDSFLHVPNIVNHINSVANAWVNYIGGELHLTDGVTSDPDSEQFTPADWYSEATYPPFVTGPLVVICSEVVPLLLSASLKLPFFHNLDDVFISGILAFDQLQIVPNNIPRIESNNWQLVVRLKMALSLRDLAKTNLAFYCAGEPDFIEELYNQAIA